MYLLGLFLCTFNVLFSEALPKELVQNEVSAECTVSNIYLAVTSGVLYVSWTAPSAAVCPNAKDYRVAYCKSPGECYGPFETLAPGMPLIQIDVGELYCEQLTVTVNTVDEETQTIGVSDDICLESKIPIPKEISIENTDETLKVSWDPIWDSTETECIVEYVINYDDKLEFKTPETSAELTISDLSYCTSHTIKIKATTNGVSSDYATESHQIDIPAVEIIKAELDKAEVHIHFQPIKNIPPQCGDIKYKVIEKEEECFSSEYTIQAIPNSDYTGGKATESIQKQPGKVTNLQAEFRTNKVFVEWDPPHGAKDCSISYYVLHGSVDDLKTDDTAATLAFKPSSCVEENIKVLSEIKGVKGEASDFSIYGEIEAVKDLKCVLDEEVKCSWSKPENADSCNNIEYLIIYHDGQNLQSDEANGLTYSFTAVSCRSSWFSVQPTANVNDHYLVGKTVEVNVEGCLF